MEISAKELELLINECLHCEYEDFDAIHVIDINKLHGLIKSKDERYKIIFNYKAIEQYAVYDGHNIFDCLYDFFRVYEDAEIINIEKL